MTAVRTQEAIGGERPRRALAQRRPRPRPLLLVAVIGGLIVLVGLVAVAVTTLGRPTNRELLLGVSDFTYSTRSLRAPAGEIRLAFANTDAVPHTFTIEALDLEVEAGGGEAARLTFDAEPGRYDFICTIPGHDVASMRGVLVVEP